MANDIETLDVTGYVWNLNNARARPGSPTHGRDQIPTRVAKELGTLRVGAAVIDLSNRDQVVRCIAALLMARHSERMHQFAGFGMATLQADLLDLAQRRGQPPTLKQIDSHTSRGKITALYLERVGLLVDRLPPELVAYLLRKCVAREEQSVARWGIGKKPAS